MKSPFPGMDPYLEQHWGDMHTRLMVYLSDQINEQLPDDLQARVEENILVDMEESSRLIYPDVRIVEEPEPLAFGPSAGTSGVAVAEPILIPLLDEPPTERHIEIVDRASGNRVVTAIELLSPANKLGQEGREAYRTKQMQYIEAGVNLVEIDLIRQGLFVLAVPEVSVPRRMRDTYLICIRRARIPAMAELIEVTLRERLPNIRIPLRRRDGDIVLELQPLIDECYRRGRYATIDYSQPLRPAASEDDQRWIETLLATRT